MNPAVLAPAAAFACALALIALMLRFRWHWAVDLPNHRSLHTDPTPRSGGVGILVGLVVASVIAQDAQGGAPLQAVGLALVLGVLSLMDDRGGLPIKARLSAHLLAAGAFIAWLAEAVPPHGAPWWWLAIALLAIAAMTNFYNFMDGANGLAGGMAVIGFGCYGIASAAENPGFAAICFSISAAGAAFLCFNLNGRIFMGDGGSVPLGFLAAALGLEGMRRGYWPGWFGPLAFAPFVADALVTLVRRILRRERFWQAHRDHYYQRLVRSGWSHPRLAAAEFTLMTACAVAALVARTAAPLPRAAAFATISVLLGGAAFAVDRRWRLHQARPAIQQ